MKKTFLLIVCATLVTITYSQVQLGAKAGINASTVTATGYSTKAGIYLGGFADISVREKLSVKPELYFSTQGGKWKGEDGKTKLNYLQVPVLAKYAFTSRFFAETGPQFGILVSAKDEYDGDSEDIKEYLKKSDFSWAFGAGYMINPNIGITTRYNLGLSTFYDGEKNSVIQVGIVYNLVKF